LTNVNRSGLKMVERTSLVRNEGSNTTVSFNWEEELRYTHSPQRWKRSKALTATARSLTPPAAVFRLTRGRGMFNLSWRTDLRTCEYSCGIFSPMYE